MFSIGGICYLYYYSFRPPDTSFLTDMANGSRAYPKYLDRHVWANCVDQDQTPRSVASDLGPRCLSLIQQYLKCFKYTKIVVIKKIRFIVRRGVRKLRVTKEFTFSEAAMPPAGSLNNQQLALLEELYSLYQSNLLTDVVLATDDVEIPCHRVVLAASSPYFR